ncbi:MAG: hypothetical protein ACOCX3_00120 [Chloroflexota bacterium]
MRKKLMNGSMLFIAMLTVTVFLASIATAQEGEPADPVTTEEPAEPASTQTPADAQTMTEEPAEVPDKNSEDIAECGAYLVRVEISCVGCHRVDGYADAPLTIPLSGGREFNLGPGGTVYAPNLTVLQDWSDQGIEKAVRHGVDPDGVTLLPPMFYNLHEGMADPIWN